MTTNQQREQLHAIMDYCIDIENQGIAKAIFNSYGSFITICISSNGEILSRSSTIHPEHYESTLRWLSLVATGDLTAIPGYAEKLKLQEDEQRAQYEKLKEKFA